MNQQGEQSYYVRVSQNNRKILMEINESVITITLQPINDF
jgi:hypothetical protein